MKQDNLSDESLQDMIMSTKCAVTYRYNCGQGRTSQKLFCTIFFSLFLRGQTRAKQRGRLPVDGEESDSSSPRKSGEPAAVPRAEHHRSNAQQSKWPMCHFAGQLLQEVISI